MLNRGCTEESLGWIVLYKMQPLYMQNRDNIVSKDFARYINSLFLHPEFTIFATRGSLFFQLRRFFSYKYLTINLQVPPPLCHP